MVPRSFVRLVAAAGTAALAAAGLGAAAAPPLKLTDTKLKNGLRVIIHEDHTAPVYSIAVVYNAGSRDERPGRTGFAHLFEHMMFKGSENIGPGEHFVLVFNNGGSMNGTTNQDRTLYYETLPVNQLDLGLFLEADRMRSLDITKDNLDNQRNAVQEERRQGLDNQPYGKSFEAFDELANDSFAYKHSVIGSMADLNAASVEDVASFFKTYYAPNNAVVAISGDVNSVETLAKVRKYFEAIPAQPAPAPVVVDEKPQTAERRVVLEDALARLSRLDVGYKTAALGSKDDAALSVLGTVLSSGRSSRLFEGVVRQKQLSSAVGAGSSQTRGTGHFRFNASLAPGKLMPDLEAAIWEEIEKVKKGPIADFEIEKARNQARRQLVGTLQSSLKAVVMKGRAPVSKEVLRVKLPAPAEADLTNGAHLMVLEDRRAPQVTMQIYIPGAGGYFDPAGFSGVAGFTASQMREGTKQWTTTQLNEELERMAASVSVGASISGTEAVLTLSSLPEHLDRVMSIAADVLLNPTFPEEEFTRYKTRTRAGLLQQRSSPDFLAQETANKVMYGNHPASRISVPIESLDKATRADLVAFHQAKYVPDHAAIAISGDISMAEARKLVEAKFGAWKRANAPVPEAGDPPAPGPSQVHFVARPGSVQTNLIVTAPGISRTNRDYDVLSVMNQIIGGGPTGRLFIILREEKGYTYGAYSGIDAPMYRGTWSAATSVRTEVTDPALRDLMAEVARMRDERVPQDDFEAAKRNMIASFALGLESPGQVLSYHVTRWRYKLPANYWDTQPQRIMAVTAEQVQAAAKQYLDPSKLQVVAVGDAAKVAEIMAKYGVVVKYDTEGKIIK